MGVISRLVLFLFMLEVMILTAFIERVAEEERTASGVDVYISTRNETGAEKWALGAEMQGRLHEGQGSIGVIRVSAFSFGCHFPHQRCGAG